MDCAVCIWLVRQQCSRFGWNATPLSSRRTPHLYRLVSLAVQVRTFSQHPALSIRGTETGKACHSTAALCCRRCSFCYLPSSACIRFATPVPILQQYARPRVLRPQDCDSLKSLSLSTAGALLRHCKNDPAVHKQIALVYCRPPTVARRWTQCSAADRPKCNSAYLTSSTTLSDLFVLPDVCQDDGAHKANVAEEHRT